MTFQFKVRDPLGNVHNGTVEALSADEATQQLRREGFHVLQLDEDEQGLTLFARGVSRSEIVYATTQLAVMVETGITISTALETILAQEQNPTFKAVLVDLKNTVEAGENFSAALARHPKHFDQTYVSLVKASEATGTLAEMLERISVYLRKEMDTRSKVRSAMAYPAVMLALAVAVTIFLLTYILPKFEPLFTRRGTKLPKPTIIMMAMSKALMGYWYLWLILAVALVAGFFYAKRTTAGRRAIDWLKINVPILGPLFRKVAISRSIRTLGTMIHSGVSVLSALDLTADVAGNEYYRELWLGVRDKVTAGKPIHECLQGNSLLPPMLVQMISSGENTGKLDMVLERVSMHFDSEVDTSIKTATSLIEPLMITAMGFVVGGIGMSLLLPIFSLSKPPGH
ncbi:MAG: type II secretion system F family protein [Planctomycetia bacterium]|nr:type II secretion system F family protein [Planctomycetia bacterium]